MERYYSTCTLGKLWGMSSNTISKLIDSGSLKAHALPLSHRRRVLHADALAFATLHGLPPPPAEGEVIPPRPTAHDLTTGQVARRMRCSQQTVIRLFDQGELKGYRIPKSRFRRIREEDAKAFAEKHGIPWDEDVE